MGEISTFELHQKYNPFSTMHYDDSANILGLCRRDGGYLIVTTEGDEYGLGIETLDKVREICNGNLRGLSEYEESVMERFACPSLLRMMSLESTTKFLEKESGRHVNISDLSLIDTMFNVMLSYAEAEGKKAELAASLEKTFEDIGLKIGSNSDGDAYVRAVTKRVSDMSFDREKFFERARRNKR